MALSLALFGGCKQYLDVAPQGQLSQAAISTDPTAAQKLVDGVYNSLYLGGFSNDVNGFQFIILTDIASDDADKGSTPSDYLDAATIDNFTVTSTNSNINNCWNGYFQAVARANQALANILLSPADATTKNKQLGEVRFLRGYFYFNLVRLFGAVPLLTSVPSAADASNPALQQRAAVADVYTAIASDLQFAVDNLPVKGGTDVGRANKQAAQAMLAKVYLYQKNYQKAYDLSAAVMSSGAYSLYPTYADIWRTVGNNNSESILEVQTGVNAACNEAVQIYSVCQGPRSGGKGGWSDLGYGFNSPTADLANAYETGDVRRAGTIIFINPTAPAGTRSAGTVLWDGFRIPSQDSVQNARYSYKAYHSRTKEPNCGNTDYLPKNVRLLRYAEVLLINAEAAAQLGNTAAAAATALNAVRTRAGLPAKAATLANIWQEHRVELALEHDRFFDLVRQESVQPGRIVPIFAAQGKTFTKGKNEIFPFRRHRLTSAAAC